MSECAGSCGIVSQNRIVSRQPNPLEVMKDAYEKRQLANREARKHDLIEKGSQSELSTSEAMELAGYKIQDGLERLAKLSADSICYMA